MRTKKPASELPKPSRVLVQQVVRDTDCDLLCGGVPTAKGESYPRDILNASVSRTTRLERRGKETVNNPDVTEKLSAPNTSAPRSGSVAGRTIVKVAGRFIPMVLIVMGVIAPHWIGSLFWWSFAIPIVWVEAKEEIQGH